MHPRAGADSVKTENALDLVRDLEPFQNRFFGRARRQTIADLVQFAVPVGQCRRQSPFQSAFRPKK